MNKVIPNGAVCIFRKYNGGSRKREIVLAQCSTLETGDMGSGYTVKEYQSIKAGKNDTWTHTSVKLLPKSADPAFKEIILSPDEIDQFKIIAIFVRVLL